MNKIIPLGCLVLMVGPSGAGKSTIAQNHFSPGEIISTDQLRIDLVDDISRQDMNRSVMIEAERRVRWRLSNGRRAVVDATHIRDSDRKHFALIGQDFGVRVFYMVVNRSVPAKISSGGWRNKVRLGRSSLIEANEETFVSNEVKILSGDQGLATVIDTRSDQFTVAKELTRNPAVVLQSLHLRGFDRLRVIGDVHGNVDGLLRVIGGENIFHLFLGDIIDYGSRTLEALEIVQSMVMHGRAGNIRANHERKIARWLDWYQIPDENKERFGGVLSHGNEVTVNQFLALTDEQRRAWAFKFRSLLSVSPDFIKIESGKDRSTGMVYGFAHGAAPMGMYHRPQFRYETNKDPLEALAMFGETDGTEVRGHDGESYPNRTYNWVDQLEARHTSIVGHAVLSTEAPVIKTGSQGGKAIFLDTGSSKDGILSFMDFHIEEDRKQGFQLHTTDPMFGNENR